MSNIVHTVKHGTAIASYTVSNFGVDNLSKIKNDDFKKKLSLITVKDF